LPNIAIRPLTSVSIAPAARLLAGSMRDNPLHRRVFGGDETRLEPLLTGAFSHLLRRQMGNGLVLAAYDREALVGVVAMVAPGHCQPGLKDKLGMLMVLARAGALRRLPRIQCWLASWKRSKKGVSARSETYDMCRNLNRCSVFVPAKQRFKSLQ